MNLRKRTLALLLTLCMLLSVAVPMVSAEEEETETITLYIESDSVEFARKSSKAVFANYSNSFRINFKSADAGVGWVAVRIPNTVVTKGTYDLQLATPATSLAGMTDVYLFNPTDLDGLTGDDLVNYIDGRLNTNDSAYLGVLDSSIAGVNNKQDMSRQVSVEEGNDAFILALKLQAGQSGNKFAYLARMYFTPVATQSNVASNGSTEYATVAAAIAAAQANAEDKTVTLIDNATEDVSVPAGITLDLNGKTLTATEFSCEGILADNKDGEGLVKTAPKAIDFAANGLLLYDSRDDMDGYRVYNGFVIAPHYNPEAGAPEMQTINSNVKRLWMKLSFTNKEAYEVIAAGGSGLTVGATLGWTSLAENVKLSFDADDVKDWAGKMAADDGKDYGFYIDFTGFDSLAAGTLTLTPFVNTVSSATAISYVHAG